MKILLNILLIFTFTIVFCKKSNNEIQENSDKIADSTGNEKILEGVDTEKKRYNPFEHCRKTFGDMDKLLKKWTTLIIESPAKDYIENVNHFKNEYGIPIRSYPRSNNKLPVDRVEDHCGAPCGMEMFTFVKRFEHYDNISLDIVYEISEAGEKINQWYIPIHTFPYGFKGEYIYTHLGIYSLTNLTQKKSPRLSLEISSSGNYKVIRGINYTKYNMVKCPDLKFNAFQGSVYAGCVEYLDIATNKKRLFILQTPCT